jgi:hypothetical protein
VKFVRNDAGFDQLRLSAGSQALVREAAEKVEAAANAIPSTTSPAAEEPYYSSREDNTPSRARYLVGTTGIRASRHEARTKALLRGMSAGG